jgi:hypothetical protein
MKEFKAPEQVVRENFQTPKVFLAGSIDMGTAEDWQTELTRKLRFQDVILMNPRRDDWDNSWEQSKDNKQFSEQVNWELSHMEEADLVVFYFDPDSSSPITLMELGYVLGMDWHDGPAVIVCCPEGFYRKGNVDIISLRNNNAHALVNNKADFLEEILFWLDEQ